MTTLNARANQAWQDMEDELNEDDCVPNFVSEQDAWEEGWETGYKARGAEVSEAVMKHYHSEFCEYGGMEDGIAVCAGECREFADAISGIS